MTGAAPETPFEKPHLIPLDAVLAVLFSVSLVLLTLSFEPLLNNHLAWEVLCFLVPALVILTVRQSFGTVFLPLTSPPSKAYAALSVLLSATVLGLGTSGIIDNYFDVSPLAEEIEKEINAHPFYEQVFLFALLPAVCEEALFRGVILNSLKSMGKWISIILTATLFTIFHGSVELFVPIFAVSLALTVIGYEKGGLTLAMLCHFLHNFLNLLLMKFVPGDIGLPAAFGMTAAGLAATVLAFNVFNRISSRVEKEV